MGLLSVDLPIPSVLAGKRFALIQNIAPAVKYAQTNYRFHIWTAAKSENIIDSIIIWRESIWRIEVEIIQFQYYGTITACT